MVSSENSQCLTHVSTYYSVIFSSQLENTPIGYVSVKFTDVDVKYESSGKAY